MGAKGRQITKLALRGWGIITIAKATDRPLREVKQAIANLEKKQKRKPRLLRPYKPQQADLTPAEIEIRAAIERERHFDAVKNKTQRKSK